MEFLTVTGTVKADEVGLALGHSHVWICSPLGVDPSSRLDLCNENSIRAELVDFYAAGGTTLIDCKPGECGRDARQLVQLSRVTGLQIRATTGFHLQKYYPASHWLWSASENSAVAYFTEELMVGMRETPETARATTIKVGYEGVISGQTRILMEAVAKAAHQTGAPILYHTEQGRNVEPLLPFFADRGIPATQLYICHIGKRPDVGLHRELASAGALLGHDTFVRPKYDPDHGARQLTRDPLAADLDDHIAIGLDLALANLWRSYGGHYGLPSLIEGIVPRLHAEGVPGQTISRLTAQNIARFLARRPIGI
ncbi:MAG: phosphotriesterase family protein [Aggregatilineales bacterium]